MTGPTEAADPLSGQEVRCTRAPYPEIGEYGLIGDTLTLALISRAGSLDWLCLPDVDSPALFAGMLDCESGGHLFVGAPAGADTARTYLDGTAVLRTRHRTGDGVLQVTDFMPLALEGTAALRPARRVLRLIEAIEGAPEVAVAVAPRPDFGRRSCRLRRVGRHDWRIESDNDFMLLRSEVLLEPEGDADLSGRVRLQPGERREVSLAFCRSDPGVLPPTGPEPAQAELNDTCAWWRELVDAIDYDGPFHDSVRRSLATLRLLTFSQSGAVLAAATTSLPEAIGGGRNFDYRFCWLRDASFVLNAFAALKHIDVAEAFFRWLMHATQLSAPELRTFYTVFGRTDIAERPVQSLEGYRGSAPVRCGNAAQSQLQLDAYGSVMTAAEGFCNRGGKLGASEQRRLRGYAEMARRNWRLPDDGLWEMPGPRVHNTYSKVMCWAALTSFARLCERGRIRGIDPAPYTQEAARIRASVMSRGWDAERGAFTGAYGHKWLDASLLLMPRMGIIPADDPRMVATWERIRDELGHGAQLRRYADGVDGIPSVEGTFTVCGFWAADYLARKGDLDEAETRIADLVAHANDLGLMAEEIDPASGAQRGNFPQGFSHAGLIGAAMTLAAARKGLLEAA